ncbi:MAG: phosphotransferase [Weeksellaceae bacterium]|nr:phosphotransferase [Weeksellaceae bacterium]
MTVLQEVYQYLRQSFPEISPEHLTPLSADASDRKYFRLQLQHRSLIATYSENKEENKDFIYIASLLAGHEIPAPKVLQHSNDMRIYLQSDAGSQALLSKISSSTRADNLVTLQQVITQLIAMQWNVHSSIDYEQLHHHRSFDAPLIYRDLFYFKHYFLDLKELAYNEAALLRDFEQLVHNVQNIRHRAFMYRDFQSRNIHFHENQYIFIDFQGGMYGPVLYDLVSLIWQAKAGISAQDKEQLFQHYLTETSKFLSTKLSESEWRIDYNHLTLLRLLQVMGAYGKLGLLHNKKHFLESIEMGIANLKEILPYTFMQEFPAIRQIIKQL